MNKQTRQKLTRRTPQHDKHKPQIRQSIHTQKPTHWTSTTHRGDIKIYRPQRRNSTHRHRRHPTTDTKKRSPHWKFNNTLLENKMYTSHIHKLIQTHLDDLEIEEQREQVSQLWELLKQNIIRQTQTIATDHHRQKQKQYQEILKAITIAKQKGLTAQTHILEKEAEIFLDQKYKGAQIRTKLDNNTNEIRDTQYLSLEQNVQRRNRQIKEVKDGDGHTHTQTPTKSARHSNNSTKTFTHRSRRARRHKTDFYNTQSR